jgi:hypothetical protein
VDAEAFSRIVSFAARVRGALWAAVALLVALGFACVHFQTPAFIPLIRQNDWTVVNGFFENSKPARNDVDASALDNPQARFYRSWEPTRGAVVGAALESRPFTAPDVLMVPFVGYPIESGVHLALRCTTSRREMPLASGNAHEYWVQRVIRVPRGFCAAPVQLVANNTSNRFYIGVGTPFAGNYWHLLKYSLPSLVYIHGVVFAVILVPVLALLLLARRGGRLDVESWQIGVALFGLTGYAMFFIVQGSKSTATVLSLSLYAACVAYLVRHVAHAGGVSTLWNLATSWRVTVLYAFTLFALLFLEAADVGAGPWNAAYRFLPAVWSSDHLWPRIVADGLWDGQPASTIFTGWHVSDRPPLMAGILMLIRPVTDVLGPRAAGAGLAHFVAKTAGIVADGAILIPIIELLSAGKSRRPAWVVTVALLLVTAAPVLLFNVIFTWPKMQSAFLALAAMQVLARARAGVPIGSILLAGVLFGLSLLSHAGVALGLVAVPIGLRAISGRWRVRATIAAGLIAIACWVPWSYWQRHVDPPGNALLKFALTGSYGFDDQRTTVSETVTRFAAQLTWQKWLDSKMNAVETLAGIGDPYTWMDAYINGRVGLLRMRDFLFVIPSLRFLGVAILLAGVLAIRKKIPHAFARPMALWLACGCTGIAITTLVMWTDHVNHTQSYVSLASLLLGAAFAMLALPTHVFVPIAIIQAVYVLIVWGISPLLVHGVLVANCVAAVGALVLTGLEISTVSVASTQQDVGSSVPEEHSPALRVAG